MQPRCIRRGENSSAKNYFPSSLYSLQQLPLCWGELNFSPLFFAPNERWFWCRANLDWLWGLFSLIAVEISNSLSYPEGHKTCGSNPAVERIKCWGCFGEFSPAFSRKFVMIAFYFFSLPQLQSLIIFIYWQAHHRLVGFGLKAENIAKKEELQFVRSSRDACLVRPVQKKAGTHQRAIVFVLMLINP